MINLTINNFSSAAELHDLFKAYDRGDNFTLGQMEAIYNLYKEVAPDTIIDVIGICCEFTGYDSIESALEAYGYESKRELENNVLVLYVEDTGEVVIQD